MCDRLYDDDPYWAAMARRGLGPTNNAYYKEYNNTSPGGLGPMFISNNEYFYTAMRLGHNYILPYKSGLQNFSPLVTPRLKNQVSECTRITYQPSACQWGAVSSLIGN
jgi:hypothetical protein